MKYLFIIILFAAVAFFIYWRLRPYLKMARSVLGFVRDVRRMSTEARDASPRNQQGIESGEKLVRCSACATWFPASRAITLRSAKETFCSHDCIERSVGREVNAKTARRS